MWNLRSEAKHQDFKDLHMCGVMFWLNSQLWGGKRGRKRETQTPHLWSRLTCLTAFWLQRAHLEQYVHSLNVNIMAKISQIALTRPHKLIGTPIAAVVSAIQPIVLCIFFYSSYLLTVKQLGMNAAGELQFFFSDRESLSWLIKPRESLSHQAKY